MEDLDIVNRALLSLGSLPAATMADTGKNQARAITAYYQVRDETLRSVPWPSCITRSLMKNMDDQACPWTASHAYLLGERVTNDTNKTYKVTTAGISASATGPTGTGSAVTDGTVIWAYVEASTALTNWCHWINTAYLEGDLVIWDVGKVYTCIIAGTSGAAAQPTGTSSAITDGTVHWAYYGTPPYNRSVYDYQYVLPADCLRVLKIPSLSAGKESDQGVQYSREGNWLYCDQDASFIKYIRREEDPTRWDALLQKTVALALASEIVYDITGRENLAVLAYQKLTGAGGEAREVALGEGAEGTEEEVLWKDV
jgi:hypothetical protein